MKSIIKYFLKKHHLFVPLIINTQRLTNIFRSLFYRLILFPTKGTGYSCNFCGAKYSRFPILKIPEKFKDASEKNAIFEGYGPNNICPKCLSISRERLVKIAVDNFFTKGDKKILHFGPTQKEHIALQKFGNVITIDLRPAYYRHITPTIIKGDATTLPFNDEIYDYVIANHILEHIPNDMAAMKEIFRVLKKDGTALLQVPYSEQLATTFEQPTLRNSQLQATLFGQGDHVRIYALKDYIKRLQNTGFFVEVIGKDFLKNYYHFALQQDEVIILAHKKFNLL